VLPEMGSSINGHKKDTVIMYKDISIKKIEDLFLKIIVTIIST